MTRDNSLHLYIWNCRILIQTWTSDLYFRILIKVHFWVIFLENIHFRVKMTPKILKILNLVLFNFFYLMFGTWKSRIQSVRWPRYRPYTVLSHQNYHFCSKMTPKISTLFGSIFNLVGNCENLDCKGSVLKMYFPCYRPYTVIFH